MAAKKAQGPAFLRFVAPLVQTLRELGNSGTAGEVADRVIERMKISEVEEEAATSNGQSRVCQRLLRESGFQQVVVTGRAGDGGIDGHGVLEVNPLVTFKVLFQCKRYGDSKPVTPSQVRDFRGAMQGRADKGLILTTGTFTSEARREATRDGVPPIELVDAEKLVAMFERASLGLRPKQTYEVDEAFFADFKK